MREELRDNIPQKHLPTKVRPKRLECREVLESIETRHEKKIQWLSLVQEKTLQTVQKTVESVGDMNPPQYVVSYLSFGPKHPIIDKFNEIQFLADMDQVVRDFHENRRQMKT